MALTTFDAGLTTFDSGLTTFDLIEQAIQFVGGFVSPKQKTKEEVEAERVRLGIVAKKQEIKKIKRVIQEKRQELANIDTSTIQMSVVEQRKQLQALFEQQQQEQEALESAQIAYNALLLQINLNVRAEEQKQAVARQYELEQQAMLEAQIEFERMQREQMEEEAEVMQIIKMLAMQKRK